MGEALTVVRDIAAAEFVDYRQMVALGSRCRTAVKRLTAARLDDLPTLSTAGDPLPDALDEMLMLLADGSVRFSDNQRSAVGVLISAGWLGRRELPDQRTPAREEESSLDGERDVSFAAMSDSKILSQRIEGGTEA